MAKSKYFKFKQFTVVQENSAMKVGTDGVVLGAWVNVANCKRILDVGAGTGLIALMLAQRSKASCVAVELEKEAAMEAKQNVLKSEWADRIEVQNISFQSFAGTCSMPFDLIVSNPPFFVNNLKAGNAKRTMARHSDSLPFDALVDGAAGLLTEDGRFALIVPVDGVQSIEDLARSNNLFLIRKTEIKPTSRKEVNRVLLEFGKRRKVLKTDVLTIYADTGNGYSKEFKQLTEAFYLHL